MRAVDQCYGSVACCFDDRLPGSGTGLQLIEIAAAELVPLRGIVSEPFPQFRAWATSLIQLLILSEVFFTPLGHRRSISSRVPSALFAGSYARFRLIIPTSVHADFDNSVTTAFPARFTFGHSSSDELSSTLIGCHFVVLHDACRSWNTPTTQTGAPRHRKNGYARFGQSCCGPESSNSGDAVPRRQAPQAQLRSVGS